MAKRKASRRAAGTGTISRDGDRYLVKIQVGIDASTGRSKWKTTRTKSHAEAVEALKHMQAASLGGNLAPAVKGNLASYLANWLGTHVKPKRAPGTYRQYEWLIREHITPILGTKRLEKIGRPDVASLLALKSGQTVKSRSKAGKTTGKVLSRSVLRLIRAVLHAAFEDAIRDGLMARNPAEYVELPPEIKKPARALKPEEAARFREVAERSDMAEFWLFLLATGTRIGEATGIRWEDFDPERGIVTIRGQLQRIDGKLVRRDVTKTHQERTLALPGFMVERLTARRLVEGTNPDPDGLIFLNPYGRRIDQKFANKRLKALCAEAGIPEVSAHKLRHTAATLAIGATGDLHAVQRMLGHSQVALTANLYAHGTEQACAASRMPLTGPQGRTHDRTGVQAVVVDFPRLPRQVWPEGVQAGSNAVFTRPLLGAAAPRHLTDQDRCAWATQTGIWVQTPTSLNAAPIRSDSHSGRCTGPKSGVETTENSHPSNLEACLESLVLRTAVSPTYRSRSAQCPSRYKPGPGGDCEAVSRVSGNQSVQAKPIRPWLSMLPNPTNGGIDLLVVLSRGVPLERPTSYSSTWSTGSRPAPRFPGFPAWRRPPFRPGLSPTLLAVVCFLIGDSY